MRDRHEACEGKIHVLGELLTIVLLHPSDLGAYANEELARGTHTRQGKAGESSNSSPCTGPGKEASSSATNAELYARRQSAYGLYYPFPEA